MKSFIKLNFTLNRQQNSFLKNYTVNSPNDVMITADLAVIVYVKYRLTMLLFKEEFFNSLFETQKHHDKNG